MNFNIRQTYASDTRFILQLQRNQWQLLEFKQFKKQRTNNQKLILHYK